MSFGGGELEGINMKVGGEGGKEGVWKGRRKGVGKEGGHCSHFTSCLVYMGCVTVTAGALCVYGGERSGAGSPDL